MNRRDFIRTALATLAAAVVPWKAARAANAVGPPHFPGAAFYTPEQFGAVGDGVTDDTAAVQACVNAALRDRRVVYGRLIPHRVSGIWFGDGFHRVEGLSLNPGGIGAE